MRRTLVLLALVGASALLVRWTHPPARPTEEQLVRGPHVFRTSAGGIRRIQVTIRDRGFVAERTQGGWQLDGAPATTRANDALGDLVTHLAGLRAVDAFRTTSFAAFGLEPPGGTLVLTTRRGVQRLALGKLNAAGSAVYARRDEQERVLQIGAYLPSAIDRVLRLRADAHDARLLSRDGIVRLAHAARTATQIAQLGDEKERLVPIRPADEDALRAEDVDQRGLLGGGWELGGRRGRARVARAGAADRSVGEDAVVAVAPLDADRIASHLRELVDAERGVGA